MITMAITIATKALQAVAASYLSSSSFTPFGTWGGAEATVVPSA